MLASVSVTSTTSGGGNFLVPNGTFIVELVLFIVVLGVVAKFILPPLQRAMDERGERLRSAMTASDESEEEAARLVAERRQILDDARAQARSTIEQATAQAQAAFDDARARGQAEHERLVAEARSPLESERAALRDAALGRLGELVVHAASRVIGTEVDSSKHRALIDELVASGRNGSEA